MKVTKTAQDGFTLIELMIVVAIVSILSALALSAYQTYIARAQISHAFVLTSNARMRIAEYGYFNGAFPDLSSSPSSDSFSQNTSSSTVSVEPGTGIIMVNMNSSGVNRLIAGCSIKFIPAQLDQNSAEMSFDCTSDCPPKVLPKSCI